MTATIERLLALGVITLEVTALLRRTACLGAPPSSSLLNARLLPAHGFADVVELARDVPGYRLHYPDGDEVPCDWLATLSAASVTQQYAELNA